MRPPRKSSGPAGFTLIELIVTISILSVILLMALQVTNSTRDAIRVSESKSVNDAIARRAFNQISRDLDQIVVRDDARIEFETRSGNDELSFLTHNRGITAATDPGARPVSLVTYSLVSDPSEGELLQRGSLGHQYDDAAGEALSLDPEAAFPAIPSANLQTVSNNIFRIEIEFLVEDSDKIERETTAPDTLENLRGIIVTIATLDDRGQRAVRIQRLPDIADKFADASPSKDTLETWSKTRDELAASGLAGYPRDALQSIRCYQRTFLLP
jgi:prepilin-type N-terminal cleavage/methylation domain-containing protein